MNRTIFYSWQSDLPKSENLNFIEDSISSSIKSLKKLHPISIDLLLDKATRKLSGSPDIAESIFTKISNSTVFIADISIINSSSKGQRKTPNPNVLIELGYAARTLGWEKIICLYNTDYGSFKDLPFDLRNRRIVPYSLNRKSKSQAKKDLSKEVHNAVFEMHNKGILTDKILDFLKKEIDQEILNVILHLTRYIYREDDSTTMFESIQKFLNYSEIDILEILKEKKTLGFYVLKSFDENEKSFKNFVNQAMGSQYYNREILNALIDIFEWFSCYSKTRREYFSTIIKKHEEKDNSVYVINSSNVSSDSDFPNRYFLMKKIDKNKGQVVNFGDFALGHITSLTNYYSFHEKKLSHFSSTIMMLLGFINKWLDLTNEEFIVDFVKNFRIKKADGEWL